jgi:hypothetical protein
MPDRLAGAVSIPIVDTHSISIAPAPPSDLAVSGGQSGLVLEDNQWVLDVAAKDSIIAGVIGDLEPGDPRFRARLERFARNPLLGVSGMATCGARIWARHWRSRSSSPDSGRSSYPEAPGPTPAQHSGNLDIDLRTVAKLPQGRLDEIWDVFGPDRLIYGSDWPNSDPLGNLCAGSADRGGVLPCQGTAAAERYFRRNSIAATWAVITVGRPILAAAAF